jgi:hypothetical protein
MSNKAHTRKIATHLEVDSANTPSITPTASNDANMITSTLLTKDMSRRPNMTLVATAMHRTNMGRHHRSSTIEPNTLIGDWLNDSGCTTHMTPQFEA